jgi:L-ascorbate metabolism protein UlaG (beta-lactamase superfamily)
VLIDPIFTERMGPVKRLTAPGIALEALPPIDVVLVTHDHRDHLDTWTLDRLPKSARYVVPLGNARFLDKEAKVDELDWWQEIVIDELTITLVPARHWSMRFPWDRNDALWGGFVIRGPEGAAYHSGDTALFDGFKEIGERCGPIDWAMLPIGAYDPRWFMKPQHMCPEEAVEAFDALGAKTMVAMHWGTFKLTDESIAEPPVRARGAFDEKIKDARTLWIPAVGETRKL